ncbi:hypothetical protein HNY73_016399 [Argiope bruennichi]|uniref:Uncharacterized protein n=1 Tax=Argiope bruennichi TaxID=94029 RepID=A0A8T0ENJ5_ARGBR|nr:hypothetical protein HNY73_016399 [Argiope bruennichi]
MPREETKDMMEQSTQMKMVNDARDDDFLFHMSKTETGRSTFESDNVYNECMVAEEENHFPEQNLNENTPFVKNRQILTSDDIKNNTVTVPNYNEYRSMDHILFYTSLPYTRMRNSLPTGMKRTPFKLCY